MFRYAGSPRGGEPGKSVNYAIETVTGVAESRHDVALVVKTFVDRAHHDLEVDGRVDVLLDVLDAFWGPR